MSEEKPSKWTLDAAVRFLEMRGHKVYDAIGIKRIEVHSEKTSMGVWARIDFMTKKHGFRVVEAR